MQTPLTLNHIFLSIDLVLNRYLLLAWMIFYPTLFVVLWHAPFGYYRIPILIGVVLLALYTLLSRVFLRWPEQPKKLTLEVDAFGRVEIHIDKQTHTNWFFSFKNARLVVLVICYNGIWCWVPRFILWLSPHNTDQQTHRHLRIIAQFGSLIPLQVIEQEQDIQDSSKNKQT